MFLDCLESSTTCQNLGRPGQDLDMIWSVFFFFFIDLQPLKYLSTTYCAPFALDSEPGSLTDILRFGRSVMVSEVAVSCWLSRCQVKYLIKARKDPGGMPFFGRISHRKLPLEVGFLSCLTFEEGDLPLEDRKSGDTTPCRINGLTLRLYPKRKGIMVKVCISREMVLW